MGWRGPDYQGEVPTLGWVALEWMSEWLVVPDGPTSGDPLVLTPEQAQFVLDFYAIDLATGKRRVTRAVLSRPKGWGKSPLVAGLCAFEAIGPAVPDGWDADGEPVGASWAELGYKPKVQILGVSEDQTANTYDPLLDMIRNGPLVNEPGIEALDSFVNVPRGRIEAATSASTSREGFRPVFAAFDQTESWKTSNGGKKLAAAVRRNLTKTGGSSIETPNSYRPGMDSVAESSFKTWNLQQQGKTKTKGLLVDHREAPADTDITDRASMIDGLRLAYGCSAKASCALAERGDHEPHEPGWSDLERTLADFWDLDTDPSDGRMYFLNQITSASDQWVTEPQLRVVGPQRGDEPREIDSKEMVVLGFDGSRGRARGKADSTVLTACTVRDGHIFDLPGWSWEHPDGVDDWEPPALAVDAAVRDAFKRFNVIGFYADPAHWTSYIADWEAAFGSRLKVKASQKHPIEWWMSGGRAQTISKLYRNFQIAVEQREMTYNGSSVLTRHILNARIRIASGTQQIGKEFPDSPNKIDGAVSASLAWQARLDAIAAGLAEVKIRQAPRRIR